MERRPTLADYNFDIDARYDYHVALNRYADKLEKRIKELENEIQRIEYSNRINQTKSPEWNSPTFGFSSNESEWGY